MGKYIDADKLREKIEFSKFVYSNPKRVVHGVADAFEQDGRAAMCDDILKKLDSLQQDHLPDAGKMVEQEHIADVSKMVEQPDVDLEKEIDACWKNWLSPSNQKEVEGVLPKTEFATYARHFYELGLKARKEE